MCQLQNQQNLHSLFCGKWEVWENRRILNYNNWQSMEKSRKSAKVSGNIEPLFEKSMHFKLSYPFEVIQHPCNNQEANELATRSLRDIRKCTTEVIVFDFDNLWTEPNTIREGIKVHAAHRSSAKVLLNYWRKPPKIVGIFLFDSIWVPKNW